MSPRKTTPKAPVAAAKKKTNSKSATGKKSTTAPSKKSSPGKAAGSRKVAAPVKKAASGKSAAKRTGKANTAVTRGIKTGPAAPFPTIPVEEAVARTGMWCDYNMELYNSVGQSGDFARAFFVGRDDIQALHDMFRADSNLIGCRMYLGMQPVLEGGNGYVWSLCMVAVEQSSRYANGIDIVRAPDSGESLVFDFSKPCPNSCDLQSELYHVPPPQVKKGKKIK